MPLPTTLPETARPATLSLDAGLCIPPDTRAIQPELSLSVNNLVTPGEGAFSAAELGDIADEPFTYARWSNPTVRGFGGPAVGLGAGRGGSLFRHGHGRDLGPVPDPAEGGRPSGDQRRDLCRCGGTGPLDPAGSGDRGDAGEHVRPSRTEPSLRPNTRLVHCESSCNPILRLTDLAQVARIAHAHGALVSVDSTFATPVSTRTLSLGVDLVVHSLTKFINRHSDALGGAVLGSKALTAAIRGRSLVYLGGALSASNAWLILRGIDTLFPRMRQINETAQRLALSLEAHP